MLGIIERVHFSFSVVLMKLPFLCLLVLTGVLLTARADEVLPAVHLQRQNKQVALSDDVQWQLRQQMMELVKSSNFHSGLGGESGIFTFAGVQQDYRDSVSSGNYLLVTFPVPQKIKTVGGEIMVAETIMGLHRSSGKNSLFTIDETGRVISHAKYAGEIWLQLENTVASVRP